MAGNISFSPEASLHNSGRMAGTRGQNLLSGSGGLGSHLFHQIKEKSKLVAGKSGNKSSVCKKFFESSGKKKEILGLQYILFARGGQLNGLLKFEKAPWFEFDGYKNVGHVRSQPIKKRGGGGEASLQ